MNENALKLGFEGFTDTWEQRKLGEFSERITSKTKSWKEKFY